MRVSLFVRARNESDGLKRMLAGVANQKTQPYETVVLDNGSIDDTASVASEGGCRVELMAPEEFTYGRALNRSLEVTRGDIIVFLSAHAVPVDSRWLDELLSPISSLEAEASYGRQVPVPQINPLEEWVLLRTFPRKENAFLRLLGIQSPQFSNANAAVKRDLLEREPFREDLAFAEDREWADRVARKGSRIVYSPEAAVYHSHGPENVKERMIQAGKAMRQCGAGGVYRSAAGRTALSCMTMLVDLFYCVCRGYWSVIPCVRSYRRRYFEGLAEGLFSDDH